jgi:hypothetical protein
MQLRIDALERRESQTEARATNFEGVIHKLDSLLSDQPSSSLPATQATHSASAPAIHNLGVSSDDDNDDRLSAPEDDTLDNADTDNEPTISDAESSTAQPHRSASAPTTASSKQNKRRRRTSTLIDALSTPLSKNTRAHSLR